jgi:hypothetical protein
MMVGISLPVVLAYSLVVSGALVWLNRTGAGAIASSGVTLVICLAIGVVQVVTTRSGSLPMSGFTFWILWVLAPNAAVLAVSALPFVRSRPWSLLLLGPLSYVVGMAVAMTTYNLLFASGSQH